MKDVIKNYSCIHFLYHTHYIEINDMNFEHGLCDNCLQKKFITKLEHLKGIKIKKIKEKI